MTGLFTDRAGQRLAAATAAVALEALILYALIFGLAVTVPRAAQSILAVVDLAPPPPAPPPPVPHRIASHRPEGAASPPNIRSHATEVVAPPPAIVLPVPPPVVAAPVAGESRDPTAGNAEIPGPGTGSGGIGNGTGSGGAGNGDGDGGGGFTPPRWLRGRLHNSDYPAEAGEAGVGGTVSVRFSIETDGRVGQCLVTRSSGNAALDRTTCRLIAERYRFRPSLDPNGRPVRSQMVEDHSWVPLNETPEGRGGPSR
jgi:protein TonB